MHKKIFSLVALTAALAFLLLPPGLFADQVVHVRILATQARVRQATAMTAPVIGSADKGQVFDVIEKAGEWFLVQLPTGVKGYLHRSVVEEVDGGVELPVPPRAQVPVVGERARAQAPEIARQPAPKGDAFSVFFGRIGYFLASDSDFKDIYGNGAVFGGELRLGRKRIMGWLEGSFRQRAGKFSYTGEKTKVKVTAIEVGALYRILSGKISPYAGAGLGYYLFNENNAPLGVAKQSKLGFCGAVGVSVGVARRLVADFRMKYNTCSMKPAELNINIGGLSLSLGMGVRF